MKSQATAHLTFTCSNLTTEILERYVKYVQSRQQKHRKNVNDVVLVFLLLTLNIFHTFKVSIVDFEKVNVSWMIKDLFRF